MREEAGTLARADLERPWRVVGDVGICGNVGAGEVEGECESAREMVVVRWKRTTRVVGCNERRR